MKFFPDFFKATEGSQKASIFQKLDKCTGTAIRYCRVMNSFTTSLYSFAPAKIKPVIPEVGFQVKGCICTVARYFFSESILEYLYLYLHTLHQDTLKILFFQKWGAIFFSALRAQQNLANPECKATLLCWYSWKTVLYWTHFLKVSF